jgi:predicted transcriptional regulator
MTGAEKVYSYLLENGPKTDDQIAEDLHMSPSSVRTRRYELEQDGLVIPVGKALTKYGRQTYIWVAKSYDKPNKSRKRCPA